MSRMNCIGRIMKGNVLNSIHKATCRARWAQRAAAVPIAGRLWSAVAERSADTAFQYVCRIARVTWNSRSKAAWRLTSRRTPKRFTNPRQFPYWQTDRSFEYLMGENGRPSKTQLRREQGQDTFLVGAYPAAHRHVYRPSRRWFAPR